MTLTARVVVGDDGKTDIAFPEPGHEIVPRTLGIAAVLLLNENHRRDLVEPTRPGRPAAMACGRACEGPERPGCARADES